MCRKQKTTQREKNKKTIDKILVDIKEKQLELSIKGKSLNDVLSVKSEEIEIPVNKVEKKVETINKNMKTNVIKR